VSDAGEVVRAAPAAPVEGGASVVTVSIHRRAKPGREREFEAVLSEVLADAAASPHARGASMLAPHGSPAEYQVLLHFDSESARRAWMDSDVHRRARERIELLSEGRASLDVFDAQEAWLVQPGVVASAPPRYKVAVLTWLGIYPVITVLLALLGPTLAPFPLPGRSFVLTACAIPLMTWVVMPVVTRVCGSWLNRAG
jgi:antibiotic biosynthesis monooxygenase (ABM) superfamily enzyme